MMVIGYIRPLKRYAEAGQRESLEGIGCERIYVEGADQETLAETIKSLRKGDVLAVYRLFLLAEPRRVTKDRPRRSLFKNLRAVEAKGATVLETDTGRTSTSHRDCILFDAIERLSGNVSAENGAQSAGRPPKVFTEEQLAAAKAAWESIKYRTVADAVAQFPEGFSQARAYALWGARYKTD